MTQFTHIDQNGQAHMVDVSEKPVTARVARASASVTMQAQTLSMILEGGHAKGDVLATARIAGIQAAKRTPELIPLCHPLMLSKVSVELHPDTQLPGIRIEATCKLAGQTGVEMEALTAASVAALTLYDMCKAVDKSMLIGDIRVLEKQGGKSGDWLLSAPTPDEESSQSCSGALVSVRFFAELRESLAEDELRVSLDHLSEAGFPLTLAGLKAWLVKHHSELADVLNRASVMAAINHQVVDAHAGLNRGDEVAFFPPVTGG